jgi:hypothetical protein
MPYSALKPFSVREEFQGKHVSAAVLEKGHNVCCLLDDDLRIIHCNRAWDTFALANNGDRAVARKVLRHNIMDFIPAELQDFYREVFEAAARGVVEFDYECSSPETFRLFRMQVLRNQPAGFALVNSLRVEQPIATLRAVDGPSSTYASKTGEIRMCSHCRRTERIDTPGAWDWVPAYLNSREVKITHGLCPVCQDYFYSKQKYGG